jgi:hypothetical protein
VTSLIGRVKNLIVEDGEVECETKANGVRGCKIGGCNFGGSLVSLQRLVCGDLALLAKRKLSEVAVVIALPAATLERES